MSALLLTLAACSGSSSSSSALPPQAQSARVRFAQGSPLLEVLVDGVLQTIETPYLQVDGKLVASLFTYGTFTPFLIVPAGVHSIVARDTLGYGVGPIKTTSLSAGGRYTLILVGSYPNYRVLTFPEPASDKNAQLSLYEASPMVPLERFGGFVASSHSGFKQLGTAKLGDVVTVNLGKSVTNFGGYVGSAYCAPASKPANCITPSQIYAFDTRNALPYHSLSRLSLFLFDYKGGSPPTGSLFGSLDE
jgi:hypothetical protein